MIIKMSNNKISSSIFFQLLSRLLLVMVVMTLSRFIFYIFNLEYFGDLSLNRLMIIFKGGFVFDLTAILYFNILVIVLSSIPFYFKYKKAYQTVVRWIFIIFNFIAIIMNSMDAVYYRFTLRRTTSTIFHEFGNNDNNFNIILKSLFDFWPVTLATFVLLFLFLWFEKRIPKPKILISSKYKFAITHIVLMLVAATLTVGGIRGGFANSTRPITLSNASKYIEKSSNRALVLNTPFAMIRTIKNNSLKKVNYFTAEELPNYYTSFHKGYSLQGDSLKQNNPNIVILILESFGKAHVGYFNKDIEGFVSHTPFLDSLCQHSYTFMRGYANGRKSIDAIPSIVCGIPSMVEPFVLSNYSGNKINSLATILRPRGYYSSFFHGAPNGSMGFDAFINQARFDAYYGKDEFNDDSHYDGMWGIWDEPFLQFFANKLGAFKQPFLSVLFTVSSHHPYRIPEKYQGVFKEGDVPLDKCIAYTDNALRLFFDNCKKQPWYDNTIFVISADHSSYSKIEKYHTSAGVFAIPLVFYSPGDLIPSVTDTATTAQQIDVMPTLLNLVKNKKDYIAFGKDLFKKDNDNSAFSFTGGVYQIIDGDFVLQFNGKKTIAVYNIKTDVFQKKNIVGKFPEIQKKLENKIKGFIQDYSNRLINNKTTVE